MVRASINVALGGILRRSDPLGRIYGWIPSGDLLGSVTRVPYLEKLYMERNTYLLLTEFEGRTVSYGPSFFLFDLWPKREARGP